MNKFKYFLLSIFTLLLFFYGKKWYINFKTQNNAKSFSESFNDQSIIMFTKWNYYQRGDSEGFWCRITSDTNIFRYTIHFTINKDTNILTMYPSDNFEKDFKCSFYFDTLKFDHFEFRNFNNNITVNAEDKQGAKHTLKQNLKLKDIFPQSNPFKRLKYLECIRKKLNITGIEYSPSIGNFIQFWFSHTYQLTYIPSILELNEFSKKIWLNSFQKGIYIKPKWNLKKVY